MLSKAEGERARESVLREPGRVFIGFQHAIFLSGHGRTAQPSVEDASLHFRGACPAHGFQESNGLSHLLSV